MFCSVIDNGADIWYNYSVNGIHGLTVVKDGEKTEYVFRKNVFGDVTHIYKSDIGDAVTLPNLTLAATYKYDAWGNCKVTDVDGSGIGDLNPIRYRGYYFDAETGMYYLNARYYDPETGRFISADDTKFLDPNTVNGLNLFAYCNSNPVMNFDPSGRSVTAIIMAALAIVGVIIGGVYTYNKAQEAGYSGWELFGWTLLGMIGGGVAGAAVGAFVGWAVPAIGTFLGTTFTLGSVITASGATVAITVTGAQIVAGIAAGAEAITILVWFSKRDVSKDKPSWVNPDMIDRSKTPQENAADLLNEKYGIGKWPEGPNTEHNKIKKWIVRYVFRFKK